ncbi:ArsR/SmtB family transcription factor, partial [Agrobacterium tumefaciens]
MNQATNDIAVLSETFRLLGDPSRLRILLLCLEGPRPVTEIAETLDLSQSLVS